MPYFRRPRGADHPYQPIPNDLLEDSGLSFKAKGLLCYLLSRSDDWRVFQSQLEEVGPDGSRAVRSALDEVREADYIHRFVKRDYKGRFKGYLYIICEEPRSADDPSISRFSDIGFSDIRSSGIGKSETTKDGDPTNTDTTQNGGGSARGPVRNDSQAPLSVEDAKSVAEEEDIPQREAVEWWHYHNERGWSRPIKSVRSSLIRWHMREEKWNGEDKNETGAPDSREDLKGKELSHGEVEAAIGRITSLEWEDFRFAGAHDRDGRPLYRLS